MRAQVIAARRRLPAALRRTLWSRKGGMLDRMNSTRKGDILLALMLQRAQNDMTSFGREVDDSIKRICTALQDEMAGVGGGAKADKMMSQVKSASQSMLMDGRLAYPRL